MLLQLKANSTCHFLQFSFYFLLYKVHFPCNSYHPFLVLTSLCGSVLSITCWTMNPSGQLATYWQWGRCPLCLCLYKLLLLGLPLVSFFVRNSLSFHFSRFSSLLLLKLFNFLLHFFLFGSDGLDHWHGIAQLFLKNKNQYVFNLEYEVKVYNIIVSSAQ